MATLPQSTLVIRELGGKKRSIELAGAALPKMGAAWKSSMRLTTTWYPGNGVQATQQVLGSTEVPSTWEGEWNTTRLVRTPSTFVDESGTPSTVVQAASLRDIFDSFFLAGQLLEVTWIPTNDQKIVRQGRASEWEFPHDRIEDIKWTVTFDWVGRGGTQQRAISLQQDSSLSAANAIIEGLNEAATISQRQKAVQKNAKIPLSADRFTLGQLEALADAPREQLRLFQQSVTQLQNRATKLGEVIKNFATLPQDLTGQMRDIGGRGKQACLTFKDDFSRVPFERQSKDPQVFRVVTAARTNALSFDTTTAVARKLTNAQLQFQQAQSPNQQKALLQNRQQVTRGSLTTTILAVHIVRQTETVASIAKRYYGDAALVTTILQANGFPLYQTELDPGTVVIIPTLRSQLTSV